MKPKPTTPAQQAAAFLRQYRDGYRRTRELVVERAPSALAEKRRPFSGVPAPPNVDAEGSLKVVKWYANEGGRLVGFYDDGADLPAADAIVVVSRSLAVASEKGLDIKTESWVLRRS
jgi:hypothetical protein